MRTILLIIVLIGIIRKKLAARQAEKDVHMGKKSKVSGK